MKCKHCGKETDGKLCIDCEKQYKRYHTAVSRLTQKQGITSLRRLKATIEIYETLKLSGVTYKIPENLYEIKGIVESKCVDDTNRYYNLQRRCDTLTLDECYELANIIVGYIQTGTVMVAEGTIKRLNNRLEHFGADRIKPYAPHQWGV